MAKPSRSRSIDGQPVAGRFKALAAARALASFAYGLCQHRGKDKLHLIADERMLDDVGAGREGARTPLGEAHWFYDRLR